MNKKKLVALLTAIAALSVSVPVQAAEIGGTQKITQMSAASRQSFMTLAEFQQWKMTHVEFGLITSSSARITMFAENSGADQVEIYRSTDGVNYQYQGIASCDKGGPHCGYFQNSISMGQTYWYMFRAQRVEGNITYYSCMSDPFQYQP